MTNPGAPHPIRSLSKVELRDAVGRLTDRYREWSADPSAFAIRSECVKELGGLFAGQVSTNEVARRFFFFRARPGDELGGDEAGNPGQFSYVPPEKCVSPGRCHIPGHPVFYGSDSFDGAIRETERDDLAEYYVGIWHTDEITLSILNLCYATNISAPRLLEQKKRAVLALSDQYSNHSECTIGRMEALLTAWSDLFVGGSHGVSAPLAHELMYGGYQNHDVLRFGSALDGSFVNYALHPRFADTLTLHKVFAIRMGDARGLDYVAVADPRDSGLVWREPEEGDLLENDPFLPTSTDRRASDD